MDEAALNAITNTDVLRALVREQMAKVAQRDIIIARRDHEIAYKTAKIDKLTHELARLRRVQFSARSERMNPAQRELFDEAMASDIAAVEAELEALQDAFPWRRPSRYVARCRRNCRARSPSTRRIAATAPPAAAC